LRFIGLKESRFKVLRFPGVVDLSNQGFDVAKNQGSRFSRYLGFETSRFLGFEISRF
jgi:hypothetical protein